MFHSASFLPQYVCISYHSRLPYVDELRGDAIEKFLFPDRQFIFLGLPGETINALLETFFRYGVQFGVCLVIKQSFQTKLVRHVSLVWLVAT